MADGPCVGDDESVERRVHNPVLFKVDGRSVGSGQMRCRCCAPSGRMTNVLISNNNDGTYSVDLNAYEPGLHTVEIEWDGNPIPGSPFFIRITQAPDEKKVRVYGPGLISGVIDTFQGIFHVDTKGGGPGALKVRIHGPKESFKVEMYRDHPKDRVINVRYNPTAPGVYTANVLWSNNHVDGSPYEIFIAESEEDLKRWNESQDDIPKEENEYQTDEEGELI